MAVTASAPEKWAKVREFALALAGAAEKFPWGESVAEAGRKVFVFLGAGDGSHPAGVTVKLTDGAAHAHALTAPGAEPAGYGLGRAGWVSVPLERAGSPSAEPPCDWVEESCRAIAPERLTAEWDTR
ncbi:MmcQ/YjbR family DNA-binding protein [Streptomyces glaucescens]|uniref:MmcQ/YjbR family DNA-binding protein n=1 Tax=Streptomyces glaucescens TaxID=1907 RepID=UPI0034501975